MVTLVFQLLLLISVVSIGGNISMDLFDLILFRTGIIALFGASLLDHQKRNMPEHINRAVFGLLALCFFNIFIFTFNPAVLATTMNIFLAVVGFYIVYTYLDITKDLKRFIFAGAIINLLFYASQRIGFDPIFDNYLPSGPTFVGGFLGNVPRLGTYLALVSAFLPLPALILAIIVGLFIQQYVMFIPVALIFVIRAKKVWFKVILVSFGILGAIYLREHIYNSIVVIRFKEVWSPILKIFFDRPWLGLGLGINILPNSSGMFSSYLQFITGVGVLGAVWFGYCFYTLCTKMRFALRSIPLLTLMLAMAIEYPVEITRLWYLIIAILVTAIISKKEPGTSPTLY